MYKILPALRIACFSNNDSHWFFPDFQSHHPIKHGLFSKILTIPRVPICHHWRCNRQSWLYLTNLCIKSCHCSKEAITVNSFMSRLAPKKLKDTLQFIVSKRLAKKRPPNLTFKCRVKSLPQDWQCASQESSKALRYESFYSGLSVTHLIQKGLNQSQE